MNAQAIEFFTETYRKPYRPMETQSAVIGQNESEPFDRYAQFINELAIKFTSSPEEARAAVIEMHEDIRRCSEGAFQAPANEELLKSSIAFRRLLNLLS